MLLVEPVVHVEKATVTMDRLMKPGSFQSDGTCIQFGHLRRTGSRSYLLEEITLEVARDHGPRTTLLGEGQRPHVHVDMVDRHQVGYIIHCPVAFGGLEKGSGMDLVFTDCRSRSGREREHVGVRANSYVAFHDAPRMEWCRPTMGRAVATAGKLSHPAG